MPRDDSWIYRLVMPQGESVTEANLPSPEQFNGMLEVLKILLPSRGGKPVDNSCTLGMELIIYCPSHWERFIVALKKPHWASKVIR
jgi:hypothetical protein